MIQHNTFCSTPFTWRQKGSQITKLCVYYAYRRKWRAFKVIILCKTTTFTKLKESLATLTLRFLRYAAVTRKDIIIIIIIIIVVVIVVTVIFNIMSPLRHLICINPESGAALLEYLLYLGLLFSSSTIYRSILYR